MSEWGRGSARPRTGVGFMVWIVVGMTLGMILSIAAVLIAYPGIDIDQQQDIAQLRAELDDARVRIGEQDEELAVLRQKAGAVDGSGDNDAAPGGAGDPARIRALEDQNAQLADEVRVLTGRLEVAEQITEEMQAALDKAPVGDVDDLKKQLTERDKTLAELDAGYAELIQRNNDLTAERDKLREELAKAGSAPQAGEGTASAVPGQSESAREAELQAALKTREGEVAGLRSDLEAANAKAAAAQGAVDAAKGDAEAAKADADAARAEAEAARAAIAERDKALRDLDNEIVRLSAFEAEAKALREKADSGGSAAPSAAPDAGELKANLIRSQAEVADLRRDLAVAANKLNAAEGDVAARERDLERARGDLAQRQSELAAVQQSLSQREGELAKVQANLSAQAGELEAVKKSLADQAGELETARKNLAEREQALAAAVAEQERLKAEVARLAALTSKTGDKAGKADAKAEPKQEAAPRELTPRDPLLVAKAMQQTPGLDGLDTARRDQLATGLIEGECVAETLADVFGKPPAPTVRSLIQALESDC